MKRTPLKRYRGFRGRSKYRAKPVHDMATGKSFDSTSEYRRYGVLQLLVRAGQIDDLVLHPKVVLIAKAGDAPEIAYHPDYRFTEKGRLVWEDSKARQRHGQALRLEGREVLLFRLWRHFGPGLLRITGARGETLREIMGGGKGG